VRHSSAKQVCFIAAGGIPIVLLVQTSESADGVVQTWHSWWQLLFEKMTLSVCWSTVLVKQHFTS